jgi:hypothetical protein
MPPVKWNKTKRKGNWAIACKGCGHTLYGIDTTIESLRRTAIAEGWKIGNDLQHCRNCKPSRSRTRTQKAL